MNQRWQIAAACPDGVGEWTRALGISPLLARCLHNRGVQSLESAQRFLEPRLRQLQDPFEIPGVRGAVDRLLRARAGGEAVTIFGDYDVDGVTATALLWTAMEALGWRVTTCLPNRIEEGYGLSDSAVARCVEQTRPRLLLAVDCGSTSSAVIRSLQGQGIDVIVVDHHQLSAPPPEPVAFVNPQVDPVASGPSRHLCSAGLAFKLVHALVKAGREAGLAPASDYDLRPLLDFVGLGTVADMVPLTGENRILAAAGLERLGTSTRPGLQALRLVSGVNGTPGAYEVGYQLGPRLNAAGRLETASTALQLLLTPRSDEAAHLANTLDRQNRERQSIERATTDSILARVRSTFVPERDRVIVEGHSDWHIGVVGIVAARVLREFYRPTLILGGDGAVWRGSARSIEGFNIAEALGACGGLTLRHGGHAMAAGVTVRPERVDELRARLNTLAREALHPEQLTPSLRLDGEARLSDLTPATVAECDRVEPCGIGNPPVQWVARAVTRRTPARRMGREGQHVRFSVEQDGARREVVWWGAGESVLPDGTFDLAFAPRINRYQGRVSVDLRLLDWKPAA